MIVSASEQYVFLSLSVNVCVCVCVFIDFGWNVLAYKPASWPSYTDSIQYHLCAVNCAVFCVICDSKFEKWHSTQNCYPLPTPNATREFSSIALVALSLHLIYKPFLARLCHLFTQLFCWFVWQIMCKNIHQS